MSDHGFDHNPEEQKSEKLNDNYSVEDNSSSREDMEAYLPPSQRKKPKWRKILGITILVLVILGAAYGIYVAFFQVETTSKPKPKAETPTPTQTNDKPKSQAKVSKQLDQTYNSSNFELSFAYPEGWKVNDTSQKLTIISPSLSLTDSSEQTQPGYIVVSVSPKGTVPNGLKKTGAVAVLNSLKITYKSPSSVQRAKTYMSYLQYTSSTIHGALDSVYITGDFGYKEGQFIPKSDIQKLDPLITVSFESCANQKCDKPQPFSLSSSSWQASQMQKTVQKILESIRVDGVAA